MSDDPGLSVQVLSHSLEHECFSYLTSGMRAHGQAELVLTVRREPGDDEQGLMPQPMQLMKLMYDRASGGDVVGAGHYTELGPAGILGREDFRGITYMPAQQLAGAPDLEHALAMVILTADELALVKAFGAMRVVARLAQDHLFFPYPPWVDRRRTSVAIDGEAERSLLSQVPRLWLEVTYVVQREERVTLTLPRARAELVTERIGSLSERAGVAFLAMPPLDASASLVWRPGQGTPQAYAPPGGDLSALGGNYCLLVPEQDADGGQIFEDGFAIKLRDATWANVREAILTTREVDVPAAGDALSFALRWR